MRANGGQKGPWLPSTIALGFLTVLLAAMLLAGTVRADVVHPLPYDLLYVRAPYFGAGVGGPRQRLARHRAPADARSRERSSCGCGRTASARCSSRRSATGRRSTRRRASRSPPGSVADLNVSFDGQWVLFTWYHDLTSVNPQRGDNGGAYLSRAGADLYKLHLSTGQLVRLTTQALTPNTGNGASFVPGSPRGNHPRIGVFNTGGTWAPGGRIVFTSNRNNFVPPRELNSGQRTMQLFAMDHGRRQRRADRPSQPRHGPPSAGAPRRPHRFFELGGARAARHPPVPALDHRSRRPRLEQPLGVLRAQSRPSFRDPDARRRPRRHPLLQSQQQWFRRPRPLSARSAGTGLRQPGRHLRGRRRRADPLPAHRDRCGSPRSPRRDDFPAPCPGWENDAYASSGIESPAPCAGADRRGKFTHPAAAPSATGDPARADLLAVYAPGPANSQRHLRLARHGLPPLPRARSSCIPDAAPIPVPPAGQPGRPPQLVTVVAEDGFNLQWPRPVVTWRQLYGVAGPAALARRPRTTPSAPTGSLPASRSASSAARRCSGATPPPRSAAIWEDRDPFNTGDDGAVPLGPPGERRGGLYGRRRLGRARSSCSSRPPIGAIPTTAATSTRSAASGCASWARSRCASRERPASRGRTALRRRTPASSPASRPTSRSPSRPSTAGAWCSTWPRPGTRCGPARRATTAAAATPTARSRSISRPRRPRGRTYAIPDLARSTPLLALPRSGSDRQCARSPPTR